MQRFDTEIERAVLGNCLQAKESFIRMLDKGLTVEDFYTTEHKKVWECLFRCYKEKDTTDILILSEYALKDGLTITFITDLLTSAISYSNLTVYFNRLMELRVVRERLDLARSIQEGEIITDEEIKAKFDEIDLLKSKIGNDNTITTLDKVNIVDIHDMEKIKTGFTDIDNRMLGFVMGSLNIITGYNGNGKSTFVNQMCIAESLSQGYKVFAYSPELTNSNLKSWLYPTIANADHFIRKTYNNREYRTLSQAGISYIDKWIKDKLFIYTDDSITTDERQLMQDMHKLAQQGVKVFIIDNLMKIELKDTYKNEYMAQKIFVNNLKNFARRYGAVVHLVAHPRKPQQGIAKVNKFDIAGSGDVTNLADYAFSIKKNTDKERVDDMTLKASYIEVMKDRMSGQEFGIDYEYDRERRRYYASFKELDKNYGYTSDEDLVQVYDQESIF